MKTLTIFSGTTPLCKEAEPSDFYFNIQDDGSGYCFISIVPVLFFDKHGSFFDETIPIDHLLPDDFEEEMECTYGCDRSAEDVREELLGLGFRVSDDVDKLCENGE